MRATALTEENMRDLGAILVQRMQIGDIALLYGDLGAGKTTLVRGALCALGISDGVRSPTYNLIQQFDTSPPILHVDLYRVTSPEGLGLDDYLETHISFIEWAEHAPDLRNLPGVWTVSITFAEIGRELEITSPR